MSYLLQLSTQHCDQSIAAVRVCLCAGGMIPKGESSAARGPLQASRSRAQERGRGRAI